jgi:hypothetical protein
MEYKILATCNEPDYDIKKIVYCNHFEKCYEKINNGALSFNDINYVHCTIQTPIECGYQLTMIWSLKEIPFNTFDDIINLRSSREITKSTIPMNVDEMYITCGDLSLQFDNYKHDNMDEYDENREYVIPPDSNRIARNQFFTKPVYNLNFDDDELENTKHIHFRYIKLGAYYVAMFYRDC